MSVNETKDTAADLFYKIGDPAYLSSVKTLKNQVEEQIISGKFSMENKVNTLKIKFR